jgi:ribosome biogenesis protein BMS1
MEPPYVVIVQGPKHSGKTTLIKSLVKHYTRQRLTDVHGPITVRANRNLRLCFYECPNDINSMIDLAKVADLALLLIDASIGFELETFEFISILQNHGLPCVMGILTHLDNFKENKAIRKIKKQMKKRFWTEVYTGAKLFHISGVKNESYTDMEIHNLARFISVLKWKEVNWRAEHSFIMADRFEYKPELMNSVFYGYIRGSSINEKIFFIPGYGDYELVDLEEQTDPIPVLQEPKKKKTHRTLKQKEKALYAPSSNVGTLKYDESTGYINLPERYVMFSKHDGENTDTFTEGQKMVRELQETKGDFEELDQDLNLLKNVTVKVPEELEGLVQTENLDDIVDTLKSKLPTVEQEYLIQDTLMTNLDTLVYGRRGQTGRKVISKNSVDSFKTKYQPKFNDTDHYVDVIKSRFMAGSDYFNEDTEIPKDDEEDLQTTEKIEKAGMKKGTYVKIEIHGMDQEIFSSITADKPLLLCGVKAMENTLGFMRTRFKTHRWNKKILKTQDPLIISLGWQRFQTLPIYCTEDSGTNRLRMLKYTPKYSFCTAIFFGPFVPVNSSFLGISNLNNQDFRISGTGIVLELSHSYSIQKKLKLIGEAYQIFKNTAYIKGMFNSQLEVSKFVGAKIKTVSGIRGMIKKPAREGLGPAGTFRATFEDKILQSDIVFLRTYYSIKPEKFYNPLINYSQQKLLKSSNQLKKEAGITPEVNNDSLYVPIVRQNRSFAPLRIPKKLEESLPYKSRPKSTPKSAKEDENLKAMMTDREKKISFFLQRLGTVKNMRVKFI